MAHYKISDLEKLSGVKAHTIRMWEKRYNVLSPLRTDSNIRYYDDQQLRKILNIVSLVNAGEKISKVGKLSELELNNEITILSESGSLDVKEEILIQQLVSSGLAYDEVGFEKAFSNSILSFGLLEAYQRVFYPMLIKIGLLWIISELTEAQEHFVTSLLKQKILTAIDGLKQTPDYLETWLLFLPENEIHDIGLLIAHYGLKKKGAKVIYLGKDVSVEDLHIVFDEVKPTHILTFAVRYNQEAIISRYLLEFKASFNDPELYLCCSPSFASDLNLSYNQKTILDFDSFLKIVE
jgi:DNA-binding transcriptional MerR regulator